MMKRITLITGLTSLLAWCTAFPVQAAESAGTIEGRIQNATNGEYLETARIQVEGTTLETFSAADGNYRLTNIPPGVVQVKAFFTGLLPRTEALTVAAGQTVQHNFQLSSFSAKPGVDAAGAPIELDAFVVNTSREMSAASLAINEQRFASNMKNVVSTDEFGDVAENNVAEFLKHLPGVTVDYLGGFANGISLNGVPADYVPVSVDGFAMASALGDGSGGTGRLVGLATVSINNLSRIEASFSPTPESEGSALAGSVNMISRSSFERARPLLTTSVYVMMRDNYRDFHKTPAPFKPTRKVHPGFDFAYVAPVNEKFGFTVSAGHSKQFSGGPMTAANTWRGAGTATDGTNFPHTTPDRPYLSTYAVRNSGKDTTRNSLGFTIDYKLSRDDRITFALQGSMFDEVVNHNILTFNVGRVLPGNFTPTSTRGAAGAGNIQLGTNSTDKTNWTYMPSLIWRHLGRTWKAEAGAAFSRGRNRTRDTQKGFFATTTARRTGLTVSFDDIFYLQPRVVTVTDGVSGVPVSPFSLDSYVVTAATSNFRGTDDTRRTAYANVGRDFYGRVPFSLKGGIDLRQAVRDLRFNAPQFTYVGPDGRATTTPSGSDDLAAPFLDESFSSREPAYGWPPIQGIRPHTLYDHYVSHPTYFTVDANGTYRSTITQSKHTEELVSAAYLRGDLQLIERRLKLTGGVRAEQTNIDAEGPLTDPTRNQQRDARGNPILDANGRPLPITTNALQTSILTYIDRGARAEKEYLRLFPSLNASYNLRENLVARAAWYTSVGRPNFNQYAGGITLPDTESPPAPNNRIAVSNVGIKAWSARTVNARLEYYFQGVGQISIAGFRRDYRNFFGSTVFRPTPEFLALYGLDPTEYGDYDVATTHNLQTTVRTTGLNLNYRQALTFLPAWARGVQVFANASAQRATGDGAANFAGYVPRSGSWGFSLSRECYKLQMNWNYRGRQRRGIVAAGSSIEPGTYNWGSKQMLLDIKAEYYVAKRFAVFANLQNVLDAYIDTEISGPSTPAHAQLNQRQQFGALWIFGVKGTF